MLIQHVSIPADDTQSVAQVLARIVGGEVTTFPPGGPQSWMVWSPDGAFQIEVTPRGQMLVHDGDRFGVRSSDTPSRNSEVHLGLYVDRPESEIITIARQAGWPAVRSERAQGKFSVVEVWVEGVFLLEMMDPEQTGRLKSFMTLENWKRLFAPPGELPKDKAGLAEQAN